jgi:uncharacterized protein YegL
MIGDPHQAVQQGIQILCNDLKGDPVALETAWISVIAYSRGAHQLVPLTEVLQFHPPQLPIGPGTNLGAALDLLTQCIQREVKKSTPTQKGDWKPMAFILTDGTPTDDWQSALNRLKTAVGQNAMNLIAIGCGEDVDATLLGQIAPTVLLLKQASAADFAALFKWVSMSVGTVSKGLGEEGRGVQLPGLPVQVMQAPAGQAVAPPKDPSQIILASHCSQNTNRGYLMRYRRSRTHAGAYEAEGAYPVGSDYFGEASVTSPGTMIDTGKLRGCPSCPYCKNPAWTVSVNGRDLICAKTAQTAAGKTQVMFVLDVTGSMRSEIDGVKDGIRDFVDALRGQERTEVEVGLVAFRDVGLERVGKKPQMPEVLQFDSNSFTTDTSAFKAGVERLKAHGGGGNAEESSLDALVLASGQRFSGDAGKVLILITDQIPYERDGLRGDITLQTTIAAMKEARIDQLHMVLPVNQRIRLPFAPLHNQIAGQTFDLDTGTRTSQAFRLVLQGIGRSIKIMTQKG